MRFALTRLETVLLLACLALVATALVGPALPQPPQHHDFADQRALWGLPYAVDVLTNLPFAVAGLLGGWLLWRVPSGGISNMQRAMAMLFFAGLALTAAGSTWYHLRPDDAGLAIDRFAMAVAFAGLLGLAAAGRVSERAGAALGVAVLLLAPAAVQAWAVTGNVLPWAMVQFGGIALALWFACLRSVHGALSVHWFAVLVAYGVAKVLEVNDHAIYELTGQWLSGHSAKHVVAALAAAPVIAGVWKAAGRGQNAAGIAFARELGVRRTGRA